MLLEIRLNLVANLYGRKRRDANKSHRPKKYNTNYDESGRVGKEAFVFKSFWRENKMVDIIQLSPEEIDARIEIALDNFAKRQLDDDPNWWYPDLGKKTLTEARKSLDKDKDK
jgi:hypothetical protein